MVSSPHNPPLSNSLTFRVRPRLLRLLGDQLIRDANLAVFELVKNAYDADATQCSVILQHPDVPSKASLEVEDNGSGMDESILRNVWMVIATDYRAEQRTHNRRTPKFNRFPLGEKGLGRLSVHKLGRFIRVITRVQGGDELVVEFDWDRLENAEDLDQAAVIFHGRKPETFPGKKHGTRIEVSKLRETWARGELRRLHRAVNSLCSPYEAPSDFEVVLKVIGPNDWQKGLLTSDDVIDCALYHVAGAFESNSGFFDYKFKPPPGTRGKLSPRRKNGINFKLERKLGRKSVPLDLGSSRMSAAAFKNLDTLSEKLAEHSDAVSKFLWENLPDALRENLKTLKHSSSQRQECEFGLVEELNRILRSGSIYEEKRFAEITFSDNTRYLLDQEVNGEEQVRLNRLLLADAYPLDVSPWHGIGKVEFEFSLFDRDPTVLKAVTDDVKGLKDYLDENGGIRIYRDGIRVYDFGEPGNDWLNLDLRRVNTPTARTSNNQILGVLRLDATKSGDLREKSNREGFIENQAYEDFRQAVISVLTNVEAEKVVDQKRVREALGKGTGQKLFTKLTELRETLAERGVLAEVEPRLKEVEKEMEIYRDQLLHAAVPGLSIGIMLHGAEKILDELREAASGGAEPARIKELVDRLYRAMRPITNLLKNPGVAKTSARLLIKEAIFSTELRLKRHGIRLVEGLNGETADFKVQGSKQMLVASLTNLIDNAIHWLEVKNPSKKVLYISTTKDLEGGPSIIVADNGPGFGSDDPEDLVTAFFSRRNGGMGLGLYIVNEVMRVNKGHLLFPSKADVILPRQFDGAVVALQFPELS